VKRSKEKNMKRITLMAALVVLTAFLAQAQGEVTTAVISIASEETAAYAPLDASTGKYYRMDVDVPEIRSGEKLEKAVLEFYVDVESFVRGDFVWLDEDSVEHVGYSAAAPLIEIYALKSPITRAVDVSQLETQTVARVPVRVGAHRRVLVSIAPIVRSFMADPAQNYGLVIGSFTGERQGNFTLKDEAFQDGSTGRIHLTFSPMRD